MRAILPVWIIGGGFILSLIAGSVNVIGLLSTQHQAVSHVTETVSNLSVQLYTGNLSEIIHLGGVILFFLLGAIVSNLIIRDQHLLFGKRYGITIMIESFLLYTGYVLAHSKPEWSDFSVSKYGL